jgi:hypothetical protein
MENSDSENDSVRLPDISFKEKLIDDDNSDFEDLDPEMKLAMEVSRKEFYDMLENNSISEDLNTVFFKSSNETNNLHESNKKNLKEFIENMSDEEQNKIFEQEVKLAMELSDQVYLKNLEEESYALENDRFLSDSDKKLLEEQKIIEIEKRSRSVENFKKKIQGLSLSFNDIRIKKYIEKILLNYIELNIDFVYVDDDIYEELYKIIDSYYLLPIQKNYRKTAITEEEDQLIRSIFRKNI